MSIIQKTLNMTGKTEKSIFFSAFGAFRTLS